MRVHMHTLCWNDMQMLPHFFRHYDPWVDKYYFFDDGSTDGSREFLEARSNVVVERTPRSDPKSWVLSARTIYNRDWKRSRGEADWVIVTNVDEHLYHPDMPAYLEGLLRDGVTLAPAAGYQMVIDETPSADAPLWQAHRRGAPSPAYSRFALFRPDKIEETNYTVGRHKADIAGELVLPPTDEIANLHYKYVGRAETRARLAEQSKRLGITDIARNWGFNYHWNAEQIDQHFDTIHAHAVDVLAIKEHSGDVCYWRE